MTSATRKKLFALAFVLVTGAVLAGLYTMRQVGREQSLQRDRDQGMAAYERQEYAEAIPRLSRYIAKHRDDADALLAFADARRRVPSDDGSPSNLKHALSVTRLALVKDPGSLKGRVMFMELNALLGQAVEADRAAQDVLELDPSNASAYVIRMQVAAATGDKKGRAEIARTAAEALPQNFAMQSRAVLALYDAGLPAAELNEFVAERRAALGDSMAGELLATLNASRKWTTTTDGAEREAFRREMAEHAVAAAKLEPRSVEELWGLIGLLDEMPGLIEEPSADELLRRHLSSGDLGEELISLASQRAWQRMDDTTLALIADLPGSPERLPDDSLGWLVLGLPDRTDLADALSARGSAEARLWSTVAGAAADLREGRLAQARATLNAVHSPQDSPVTSVCQFLQAICLDDLGERSLSRAMAEQLAQRPEWVRARQLLGQQALRQGDNESAYAQLQRDPLPRNQFLILKVLANLEEEGHRWSPGEPSGLERIRSVVQTEPAPDAELLAVYARAQLANGDRDGAQETTDRILRAATDRGSDTILTLAQRLAPVDPQRAHALREKFLSAELPLEQRIAGARLSNDISVEDARAEVEAALENADPDQRRSLGLLLAALLEEAGSPESAAHFEQLSADYPGDPEVQIAALHSDALWKDPEAVRAAIGRLRALTGDDGLAWRVYEARLTLQENQSEEIAAKVVLDLTPVLNLAPGDPMALDLTADAYTRLGDFGRAASFATRAADAADDDLRMAIKAVRALVRSGSTDEARARARSLDTLPTGSAADRLARATLFIDLNMPAQGLADWRSLARSEDPNTRARAARALAGLGDPESAAAALEPLTPLAEGSRQSAEDAADALVSLNREDEAMALLHSSPVFGGQGERQAATAELLARHVRSDEDLDELAGFARTTRSGAAWATAIRRNLGAGRLDMARELLEEAKRAADDMEPLRPFERALEADDADLGKVYLNIAAAALRSQQADWAPALAEQVESAINGATTLEEFTGQMNAFVASHRDVPLGWLLLTQTQVLLDKRSEARRSIAQMLQALPADPKVAENAVRMYIAMFTSAPASEAQQLLGEALPIAREAQRRLPQPTVESSIAIASLAMAADRPREAWDAISPWLDQLSTPQQLKWYTVAALANGQLDAARDAWWRQGAADPEHVHQAIALAGDIPDPTIRSVWLNEAAARLSEDDEVGRHELTRRWYEFAVSSGNMLALKNALALTETPTTDPKLQVSFGLMRGSCLEAMGRTDEAIEAYRAVLRINPDQADAANNLAYILLHRPDQEKEAAELARRAVASARSVGASASALASYLDTLGTALLRTGDPTQAAAIFREALDVQPGYEYALVGLAESLAALGQPEDALAALNRLPSSPSEELAARIAQVRASVQ